MAAAVGSLAVGSAHAVPVGYNDFSAFQAALSTYGLTSVLHDFDNVTADGSSIDGATVDGITFSDFSISSGATPIVSDVSDVAPGNTRSAPNAIGTSNGGTNQKFQSSNTNGVPGDGFTISASNAFAIGAWFMTTTSGLLDGDLRMTVGTTTQNNAADPNETYNGGPFPNDGVAAYFIGFIDPDAPITSATLSSTDEFQFEFRVDDVYTASAPLPSTLALLGLGTGLLGLTSLRRRRMEQSLAC